MVICHAFYKGCLFLGAGSVIHGNHDHQDMRLMGRFRKFLPYTALAMVVAWLAIAGVPPFSGFWSKDEIISSAFEATTTASGSSAPIAAVFTGFYMTRLIFLTFYGNERATAEPGRDVPTAVPVVSGGSDGARRRTVERRATPTDDDADSDPSPTVRTASRCATPAEPKPPHESPTIMVLPIGVLAVLAAVGGLIDLPFEGADFLTIWLEPVFHGVPEVPARPRSCRAPRSRCSRSLFALTGLALAYLLYRSGLRRRRKTRSTRSSAPSRPCSATPTTTTPASRRLVGGPGRAFGELARPGRRRQDHRRRGQRRRVAGEAGSAARCATCRTAWCGATRSASRSAPSRSLLYLVLWAGR